MTDNPPNQPGVYLVLPPGFETDDQAHRTTRLITSLQSLPVSAVLLPPPRNADANSDGETLRPLVATIQNENVAAIVSDDAKLARTLDADGVHLPWRATITTDYETARGVGGGQMMIGADAGKSRHDAMVLAESGADYIAFGVPPELKDQESARARQAELIAWWAELFEIPVVAFHITTPAQGHSARQAGADFIAATLPPNSTDQSAFEDWLADFAASLEPDR